MRCSWTVQCLRRTVPAFLHSTRCSGAGNMSCYYCGMVIIRAVRHNFGIRSSIISKSISLLYNIYVWKLYIDRRHLYLPTSLCICLKWSSSRCIMFCRNFMPKIFASKCCCIHNQCRRTLRSMWCTRALPGNSSRAHTHIAIKVKANFETPCKLVGWFCGADELVGNHLSGRLNV